METILSALVPCPTRLSENLKSQFERDGYLAFHDVLSPDEIAAARAELARIARELAREHTSFRNGYGETWRAPEGGFMIQFERGQEPNGPDDPDLELKVRKFHAFLSHSAPLNVLATAQARIRGVLEGILGENPILFQDMALVKPPFFGSEKPWHQDDAYFAVAPLDAICGVWIALDDATPENGCMHVLPGWHKMGALRHFHGKDCEIVEDRLDLSEVVPVPLPAGGAMFFSGILPHQTPDNASPDRRRALQFHYRSAASQILPRAHYDAIFAENDGSPASCAAAAQRGF